MKVFLLLSLVALTAAKKDSLLTEYRATIAKYNPDGMLTARDPETNKKRFNSFKKFKRKVDKINADDAIPFDAEANSFSILTEEERYQYTGMNVTEMIDDDPSLIIPPKPRLSAQALPEYVDWVSRHAQPAVKTQGSCQSCWAFAATSAIEASYYLTTGDLMSFSDQELLDCSYAEKKDGCHGGWLNAPVKYVRDHKRLACTKTSAYQGRDGVCDYSAKANALTKARVTGFRKFQNDQALLGGVAEGIVAVAIYTGDSFFMYKSGVYSDTKTCTPTSHVNHGVSVVGYGTENGVKYWRVRNSWGKSWGDGGYIKMSRDLADNCRIGSYGYQTLTQCNNGDCFSPKFIEQKEEENQQEEEQKEATVVCKDKYRRCNLYTAHCDDECKKWYTFVQIMCKKTCGLCVEEEEEGGDCPGGTARCSDGVCRPEHMCRSFVNS